MNKLLHANMMRLKISKIFWICCISTILILTFACWNQYHWMQELQEHYYLDNFLYGFLTYIGIMLSVFSSLFIGTDYNDGTIRNKIISGHTRTSIYLANGMTCSFVGIAISCISILTVFGIGTSMFGTLQMSPFLFVLQTTAAIIAVIAYTSVFNLLAMLITNRTYTAIVSILLAIVLIPISSKMYNCLGIAETDYSFNQQMKITLSSLTFSMEESTFLIIIILLICCLITLASNLIGILLFRRKDLK